ncbi:MAG: hypothetical protein Q9167_005058 [Letrouitia subvulpina]
MSEDSQARGRFTFQHCWFELIRREWEQLTSSLRGGQKLTILEIGAFEGASTTWILDNLMAHPHSRITVIDAFEGGMEHQDGYDLPSLESRFRSNVSNANTPRSWIDDALLTLRQSHSRFDFIYIDASHVAFDVLHDAVLCWRMLNLHGTIVFDDWVWKGYMQDCYNPHIAIKAFLQCVAPEVETRETEPQMWVTKVDNHTPPISNPDPALYHWDKGLAKKPC